MSSSAGVAYWASTPPFLSTAMRSPSLIASSMSWVTKTIVLRMRCLQAQELVLQALAVDRVDGAERLVHEHQRRVGGQGAGDADALALAAGELRGVAVARLGRVEPDELEQLVDAGADAPRLSQPSSRGTVAMFSAIVWCGKRPICWIA